MTKENRENAYKHLRDLEKNYEPLPGRDHDLEKRDVIRAKAKREADEIIKKYPDLEVKPEPVEEVKPEVKKSGKK